MVNLPIFIMLLGILVSVANLTASTWNYEPTEQTIETLDANTAVTFANPSGEKLAKKAITRWRNGTSPSKRNGLPPVRYRTSKC